MNKKIIPALLVFLVMVSVFVYGQRSQIDSPFLDGLDEEESRYYGKEICIDPDTGEIKVLMEEYAKPLEVMAENPGSVFPVDTEYLQKLSVVVDERQKLVDGLLKSDGIKQYRDLAAGNPLGDFVNVKVLPVMEGAGDIVRVSTELYRDASGQALAMSTAPLFTAHDITQAARNGAVMNLFFNGMMGQLESNGELEKAVDYAAGIITQQTQAQGVISNAHSYMNLAEEGARSASNMFALAESVGDRNPHLANQLMTIGMFQMAQSLANVQEASKLKMLVLFMLLNDIRFNKIRYMALMTALGPPCDIDPMPPCPGCPLGFYQFMPRGCPEVGPYPPGMPPLPGSAGGGGGAGGGSPGPGGMAVAQGCAGMSLTGASAASQEVSQDTLPIDVFTKFPIFEYSIETPEIVPVALEPNLQNGVNNYIKKLRASKVAFIKEKIKGARALDGEIYLGRKHVEISLNGDVVDYSTGSIIESLGKDFGSDYSEFRFAEKRLNQVLLVAELESEQDYGPAGQSRYIKAYKDMMRADLKLLDLLHNHELERIQSSSASYEAKQAKASLLNREHVSKKIDSIESAISDKRLAKFIGKVPSRAAAIIELMKKRELDNNVNLVMQVTDDQDLAGYYVELKQSAAS